EAWWIVDSQRSLPRFVRKVGQTDHGQVVGGCVGAPSEVGLAGRQLRSSARLLSVLARPGEGD
ncbi:MAG: hypothetical protein ACK53L_16295, partial [Pirellulaceae bacterium]